jgi:hypothetical protein
VEKVGNQGLGKVSLFGVLVEFIEVVELLFFSHVLLELL